MASLKLLLAFSGALFVLLNTSIKQTDALPVPLIGTSEESDGNLNPVNSRAPRQDDDDDEPASRPVNNFPGVANIILGALTGDVRRIIEDGAFSFVSNKGTRDHVFLIFNNLLGKTTKAPPSTKPVSKKPRIRSTTATTEDPEEKEGEEVDPPAPVATTKRSVSVSTGIKTGNQVQGQSASKSPQNKKPGSATARPVRTTTPGNDDEDEFASEFEEALLPYLPPNPQDAVIPEFPEFVD